MITIDENTLQQLGVKIGDDTAALLEEMQQQLNERVGAAVLELLDDEEAKEYVALAVPGGEDALEQWVKEHVPDYEEVVQDELDILLGEVASSEEAAA